MEREDHLKAALADRYAIEREIGSGGMATVYLATDIRHDRRVALKVLRPDLAASIGADRFLQEVRVTAYLQHPHILPLFDSGEADGFLFYVMPFVEGESLRDRLVREKQLAIDDALQIAKEVADALSYAHSQGVVHRDVKPENILLESGHAVVADFGIARAVDAGGGERLTQTGFAVGTPAYMSPEQAAGEMDLDGRSDLYALGCVTYEMLAGRPPFTGPTYESLAHQHLTAEPPSLASVRPSVPGWVAAAIERSLAKTPADRFNPIAQFGEALAPRATVTTDPRIEATVHHKRRRLPQGIVVRSTVDIGSGGESRPGENIPGPHYYPTWTPDGSGVRFCADELGRGCDWKEVGKLGGSIQTVTVPRVSDRYAWSRDGTRVAFTAGDSIFAYSVNGEGPRLLGVHPVDGWQPHSLVWSPDGQRIAYVNGNAVWRTGANISTSSIWIIDAGGGDPVPVTDEASLDMSPQWLPDNRHLLFVSNRDGPRGIYLVETGPEGALGPVRSVLPSSDPHTISVSADGRRLAYAKFTVAQNIWSVPRDGTGSLEDAVPVTRGNQRIEEHDLSPDAEWLVYDSDRRGEPDIYAMRLDGGTPQRIVDMDGTAFGPEWSPDGQEIAFYCCGTRSRQEIYVVSADGGAPVQITAAPGWDSYPTWSPDGLSIAYGSQGPLGEGLSATWVLTRTSIGSPWGDPEPLTDLPCRVPDWAPDGGSVVCATEDEIVRISTTGEIIARMPVRTWSGALGNSIKPRFSPDGAEIFFLAGDDNGQMALWSVPANGGDPTLVVSPDNASARAIANFLTVGEDHFYLTLTEYESDIWVMDLEW